MPHLSNLSPRLLPLLLPASLAFGCGGDSSGPRPGPEPPPELGADPFSCSAGDGYEYSMIQDFEFGVATSFYVNYDESEGASIDPTKGTQNPVAADIEGGRCGVSTRAFQMRGEGLRDWGMVFGWQYRDERAHDLTDWEGLSFWARKGPDSGSSLFFSVFDPDTTPAQEKEDGPEKGSGVCEDTEVLEKKCDAYGTGFGLSEEWRFFAIPFSDLQQRGFGVPTDELQLDKIFGFNWAADIGKWDVWVDDVALFRSPGSGAGGAGGAGDE